MASLGKKSANWTSKEDDKLLDLLIEQRAKGMVKFDWTSLRAVLRNYGIDKDHSNQEPFYGFREEVTRLGISHWAYWCWHRSNYRSCSCERQCLGRIHAEIWREVQVVPQAGTSQCGEAEDRVLWKTRNRGDKFCSRDGCFP
uniref:Uncharacterized protein n=1 Tax=Opuntia streptacantha TaxID=393608 RepID=A0A7C9APP2_OPUST